MSLSSVGSDVESSVGEILSGYPSKGASQRTVRVFVSSTFADLQLERELLVKRVFPFLRDRCETRGVALSEVDLRWGVTPDQAQNGKVLEVCLREIAACEPYFLAILGDRYGWVPDQFDPGLLTRFRGLSDLAGLSATAIEIRYRLLSSVGRRDRTAFYLRASTIAQTLRDPRQEALREEVLNASGAIVRDGYTSLDELENMVVADLSAMIDADFPAPPSYDTFDSALRRQAFTLLLSRPKPAPSRDSIQVFDSGGPAIAVVGPQGSGKSTLVRHWLRQRQPKRGERVVLCIVGVTVPADLAAVLRFLCAGVRFPARGELPYSLDALRLLFSQLLLEKAVGGENLVLVLDELDRLPAKDGGSALTWLPDPLPTGMRVVVTASPGQASKQLALRQWPHIAAHPINDSEIANFASEYLSTYGKQLSEPQLESLTKAGPFTNPQFLVTVLEEIRGFGSFDRLDDELYRYAQCGGLHSLFEQVLARLERDFETAWPGLVGACLCPLALAREGLNEEEIRTIAGGGEPVPMAHWSPLRFALHSHLLEIDGVFSICIASLASVIRQRYLHSQNLEQVSRKRILNLLGVRKDRRSVAEMLWHAVSSPKCNSAA
jgi:hypothetical protein